MTSDFTREPLRNQTRYKLARFEEILQRVPQVTFTFIGDDGEQDLEIFDAVRSRHPHRVAEMWIRRVHPNPARPRWPDQRDLAELLTSLDGERENASQLRASRNFTGAAGHL